MTGKTNEFGLKSAASVRKAGFGSTANRLLMLHNIAVRPGLKLPILSMSNPEKKPLLLHKFGMIFRHAPEKSPNVIFGAGFIVTSKSKQHRKLILPMSNVSVILIRKKSMSGLNWLIRITKIQFLKKEEWPTFKLISNRVGTLTNSGITDIVSRYRINPE
jgi:hypothetical protein